MTRPRLAVAIQNVAAGAAVPPRTSIRKWIGAALRGQGGEVGVRIVDSVESAQLNERWRKRPGATNVLSFPAGETPAAPGVEPRPLGDVVICAPVVASEAVAQGKALEAHWAHIVIHGALHLIGYDHVTDAQARVMENRERELLAGFGFSDPYAPRE